uniref:peptidylprolyl isomerase n=1 Tax=Amblyomma aureolatum TaxID=187763 RepID=A0A1E1XFZ2_9ACAR
MEKKETSGEDCSYVPSVLKEPVTLENVQNGMVFEIEKGSSTTEQEAVFEAAKVMENLRLDLLNGGEDEDEIGPGAELALPFERMALSMGAVTKDRGVLKKVLRPGAGPVVAPGSGVCFHYNAYLEMADEPFDSTRLRNQPYRCLLDNMIIPGLALAVAAMRKGEIARIMVEPQYAFGRMGCPPRIPANATILYEVELLYIVSAQDEIELKGFVHDEEERRMPFPKLLERCRAKRQNGNTFYHQGELRHAIKCYSSAIRALEEARTSNEGEDKERCEMLLGLYNNAALCHIKTGRAAVAVAYAKRALLSHPNNARALYRCGVALKMQGDFDDAVKYLRKALKVEPHSPNIAEQLRSINNLKQQLHDDESAMCRRMFGTDKKKPTEDEAKRIVALEKSGITPKMKTMISESLEKLKQSPSGNSLPFTTGFTDAHFDYIRAVSRRLGLKFEDLPDEGVKVYVD